MKEKAAIVGGRKNMIVTVTLNPAIDYIAHLNAPLDPRGINRTAAESFLFGGKGINVSRVLQTLGMPSLAVGFIAGPTGDWLAHGLQQMGLETRFVKVENGMTRINVKIKAAHEAEINGMGPEITEADLEQLCVQLESLGPDDILVLAGSVPSCLPGDTYCRILDRLSDRGVRTVVDAEKKLLPATLPYHPFLIKPNRQELSTMVDRPLLTDDDLTAAAGELQAQGARNVLVSLGGDGALLLEKNGAVSRVGCPQGKVINSVGAGDSMVAGFLTGLQKTGSMKQALLLGIAAGSATAFSEDLADRKAIDRLYEQLKTGV